VKSLAKKKSIKELIAIGAFALGMLLLILPSANKQKLQELPVTGNEPKLEIEIAVDKEDVQRDNPSEGAQELSYKIKIKNTAPCVKTPLNIILALDKSGSMLDLLDDAKTAGSLLIENLDFTKDKAGIVTYDENSYLNMQLSGSKDDLLDAISSTRAGGNTNIGSALASARNELISTDNSKDPLPVIIIFTDGRANKPVSTDYAKQYALDQATETKNRGIRIISIAYGTYSDKELMQEIASNIPGSYYYAPTGEDMKKIYLAISENLQGTSPDTKVEVDLSHTSNIVDIGYIPQASSFSNALISWNLGTLQCQESALTKFNLNINGNASDLDIIDLIATVTNSTNYSGQNALSSNNVITTVHAPLFNITKTDHKETALPGEELVYEIQIENLGTGNGYGISVTDILPDKQFSLVQTTISGNGLLEEKTINWDNEGAGYVLDGTFEPTGSSWQNTINFGFNGSVDLDLAPGIYLIENTVELSTLNGYRQSTADETEVPYAPDLEVVKSSSPETYTYPGGEVVYTLTVRNNGNLSAKNVLITDDFDEHFLVIATGQGAIYDGKIIFEIENLDIGESKSFTYKARVVDPLSTSSQIIENIATVSSDDPDIDPSNNTDLHEVIATIDPILSIDKTSNKTTYALDEEIEYTITIKNNSSANAYKLVLEDTLSQEFDYIPGTVLLDGELFDNPVGTHTLLWEFPELPLGETYILKYKVRTNSTCVPENYVSEASVTWRNDSGTIFDPANDDCIIAIIDSQDEIVISPEEESSNIIESLIDDVKVLGASLVNTGEALIYLKAFVGLLLIMPLPLILIFGKEKNKKVKSSTKKHGPENRRTKKKDLRT